MDSLEERQPFLVRVFRGRRAQDPAVEVVHCGKQRDRAMPDIVVGAGADMADAQRQAGLGPLQGLALAFLVATEHQRPVGRVQVQTNDIPELGLEIGVAGQFEDPRHVGLDFIGRPNPPHARRRDPDLSSHTAYAPAGFVRRRLGRQRNQPFLLGFGDRRSPPPARRVLQAGQPETRKPMLPMHHDGAIHPDIRRRLRLAAARRPRQDDPRPPTILCGEVGAPTIRSKSRCCNGLTSRNSMGLPIMEGSPARKSCYV